MIELIVVITLIGILGVYAQSRLSTEAFDERFYADDLKSALRFAQKTALATGCSVRFNLTASGFELLRQTAAQCNNLASGEDDFGETIKRPWQGIDYVNHAPLPSTLTTNLVPGTLTNPAIDAIIFFPQGWACTANGESSDVVAITLTGQSATRMINVVCSTGFVYAS